jgi:pimeloyl-ACP methyl ester carboxylesterase
MPKFITSCYINRVLVFLLLTIISCSEGKESRLYSEDIKYRTVGDDGQNYYVTVFPDGEIQGLVVLLPNFAKSPEKFLYEIKFDSIAAQNGLLIMVPFPQGWKTDYLNNASTDTLNTMIKEVSQKYGLGGKKFVIGGFSIGGTGALRYAEKAVEGTYASNLTLAGAFTVDAPLDFERLWFSFEKELRAGPNKEAEYFLNAMRNALGGEPNRNLQTYARYSPFLASDGNGGRAHFLKTIPLRFYVEVDTSWWKAMGWLGYEDQNVYDQDRMIQRLREFGNKDVEQIKSTNKGYRKDGKRHPHSWSIVDERELTKWIIKIMK